MTMVRRASEDAEAKRMEARWRAEADLEALTRAQEIMSNSVRLRRAQSVAAQKASEASKAVEKLKKIATPRSKAKPKR